MARRTNPSMRETYANVKQKASTLKSLTKQGVAAMKKHRDAEKKGLHHTVCNDCGAEDSAFVTMAGLRVPTDICTVCGGRGQAIVYRDNATFTLDQTYGSGHGDRTLIQAFYARLNKLYPGSTPIPIPPESQIHPQHDAQTQAFIFADYTVRKIVPITLRDEGLKAQAEHLVQLDPITDLETARAAASAVFDATFGVDAAYVGYDAYDAVTAAVAATAAYDTDHPDRDAVAAFHATAAARAAANSAAYINRANAAMWKAVNEMLQAL